MVPARGNRPAISAVPAPRRRPHRPRRRTWPGPAHRPGHRRCPSRSHHPPPPVRRRPIHRSKLPRSRKWQPCPPILAETSTRKAKLPRCRSRPQQNRPIGVRAVGPTNTGIQAHSRSAAPTPGGTSAALTVGSDRVCVTGMPLDSPPLLSGYPDLTITAVAYSHTSAFTGRRFGGGMGSIGPRTLPMPPRSRGFRFACACTRCCAGW